MTPRLFAYGVFLVLLFIVLSNWLIMDELRVIRFQLNVLPLPGIAVTK